MTTRLARLTRPAPTATPEVRTRHRRIGFTLALIGLTLALVGFVANLVAAGQLGNGELVDETLAWSFGRSTAAFGTIKLGIGVVLIGILIQLWHRVETEGMTSPLPGGVWAFLGKPMAPSTENVSPTPVS